MPTICSTKTWLGSFIFEQWRAPEEYYDKPLNEQIDIWSLGNNVRKMLVLCCATLVAPFWLSWNTGAFLRLLQFYALLTGYYPFAESDTKRVQRLVQRGETAPIDPRYATRSFGDKVLAEIIHRCWVYEPDTRITIYQLVNDLRQAVDSDRQQKSAWCHFPLITGQLNLFV